MARWKGTPGNCMLSTLTVGNESGGVRPTGNPVGIVKNTEEYEKIVKEVSHYSLKSFTLPDGEIFFTRVGGD